MLHKDCPWVEHIHSASTATAWRTGIVIIAVVHETAVRKITIALVSHLNASAKPFPHGCPSDNLCELDNTELHDHTVLGAALVGNQVKTMPSGFRCGIIEVGGVARGEGNGILIRA